MGGAEVVTYMVAVLAWLAGYVTCAPLLQSRERQVERETEAIEAMWRASK